MKWPKVLVAAPTYDGKDYVFHRWLKHVKSLTYPNYDVLVVDNSKGKTYVNKLKRRGVRNVVHVRRGKNSREAVARASNYIMQKVLRGGYDYWMSIETDVFPPKDVIQRLMRHNVPVVGTIYEIGYHNSKNQPRRPCLFKTVTGENGTKTINLPPEEGYKYVNNGLQKIHGTGLGCTLIKRWLLEFIGGFWWDDRWLKHPDVYFFMDVHNAGIQAYVDGNIVCPHYNSRWDDVKDA